MATRLETVEAEITTLEAQLASLLAQLSDPDTAQQLIDIRQDVGPAGAVASWSQRIKLIHERLKVLYEERTAAVAAAPILQTHEVAIGYDEIGADVGEYIGSS